MNALVVACLIVAALGALPGLAQRVLVHEEPEAARLITSDIQLFWRAFDEAPKTSVARLTDAFQRDYIDAGSPGLKDFARVRLDSARALAEFVRSRPRFYAAIRQTTLTLETDPAIKASFRGTFRRLKTLYPAAVFPDVYFVIGRLSTGGTVSSAGLLIAVEMNALDRQTPIDELSPWERATIGQIPDLQYVVAHELVHVQQRLRRDGSATLLTRAVAEGAADFIGELISGRRNGNRAQHAYGNAHERALWDEFRDDMGGRDASRWIGQADRSVDRPADLGYYVGYKICEAFYAHSEDKTAAVRAILEMTDADRFLRQSGYSGGG